MASWQNHSYRSHVCTAKYVWNCVIHWHVTLLAQMGQGRWEPTLVVKRVYSDTVWINERQSDTIHEAPAHTVVLVTFRVNTETLNVHFGEWRHFDALEAPLRRRCRIAAEWVWGVVWGRVTKQQPQSRVQICPGCKKKKKNHVSGP